MVLAAFAHLLQHTMGLDVASIGASAIAHAVQERLSACKLKDVHAYWEHIGASETELQALIEAVVVPETWFWSVLRRPRELPAQSDTCRDSRHQPKNSS